MENIKNTVVLDNLIYINYHLIKKDIVVFGLIIIYNFNVDWSF